MQNNTQPSAGYEPQGQNTPNNPNTSNTQNAPYDDQITLPAVPQGGEVPPSPQYSFEQGAVPPNNAPPATTAQKRPPVSRRLLIIGGIIVLVLVILGIAGALLVPRLTTANNQPAATPAATPGASAATRNPYAQYLAQYRGDVRSQVAQGLHLSDAQLEDQLASGKTLSDIAAAQKISTAQLQTIVTNAFQTSFQPAVSSGKLTQKQVNAEIKRMLKQPKVLDRYLAAPAAHGKKGVSATPTATS